jgi:uncharacterized protein
MNESTPPNTGEPPNSSTSAPDSHPAGDAFASPTSVAPPPTTVGSPAPVEQKLFQSSALVFVFLRLCIYLVLGSLALPYAISAGVFFFQRVFFRGASGFVAQIFTGESIGLIGVLAAASIMSLLEKRSFGEYGLPRRGAFGKLFWMGALLGLAEISAVVGAMAAFGAYHFGTVEVHGAALVRWAASWAIFFLIVGLYEEFQFRGYVQFTVSQALGFWPAAVLLSLAFGLVHIRNSGENWTGVAGVILTGLLWCFTLRRTGNLWLAVGMHASFDFGETFLYSVPDSGLVFPGHLSNATIAGPTWLTGGSVGPEASVFDFVMLILFFFVIHWMFPAQRSKTALEAPLG